MGRGWLPIALAACASVLILPAIAEAHTAARAFIMLLPTGHITFGGAAAVLVSFLALAVLPDRLFQTWERAGLDLKVKALDPPVWLSALSTLVLLALIVTGLTGPTDPLDNLIVLIVWIGWWIVLVLAHPALGHLWPFIDPFRFPGLVASRLTGGGLMATGPGHWPAVLLFAAFSWFQLVYPAPEDPDRLALATLAMLGITLFGAALFGAERWRREGDPFALMLRLLALMAPVQVVNGRLKLVMPGAAIIAAPPLPWAGTVFVLVTLGSIAADALAHTFFWMALIGVNPLDEPGRTALMLPNSLGLMLAFGLMVASFIAMVALGWWLAGKPGRLEDLAGRFALSLIPISIAFHFAHFLPDSEAGLQYLMIGLSDPFALGWDLFGWADHQVTTSLQQTLAGATRMFAWQTGAVVAGHVVAVFAAHGMLIDLKLGRRATLLLETPLALYMVGFTAFGLWLLSAPVAG